FLASSTSFKLKKDKNSKEGKKKKTKQRLPEDGYRSKIQRFLNPCKSYPSNKQIRRRLKELERKVNDFEKFYSNALVNWVKDSKEKEKSNRDDVTPVYVGRNEKKKVKLIQKADEASLLEKHKKNENDKKITNKKGTRDVSKKQRPNKSTINFENPFVVHSRPIADRGIAKNRYTMSQQRRLSPSAVEEEFSADSNITITPNGTGKYYFVTSTAGYVKEFDEEDDSSAPYEAAANVAKFSKKNLLCIFNQEILPRCIGSSHKNSNRYKSNKINTKEFINKYVSHKSTSTERAMVDKAVNTKERYYKFKEENLPTNYPLDIMLNTKPDTFETDHSQIHTNDCTITYEILNTKINSTNVCFTPYSISSSSTSSSEISDNYIRLAR
ncbi:unnamed protein product, partial [Nezara viridula]